MGGVSLGSSNFDREEMLGGQPWVDTIQCTSISIFDTHGN
jgi:hypothetical protein